MSLLSFSQDSSFDDELGRLIEYSDTSRTLIPDYVLIKNGDTILCWGMVKSRSIAKKIVHSHYIDHISILQTEEIMSMDSLIDEQNKEIVILKGKINNFNSIDSLREEKFNTDIYNMNKCISRQKFLKWIGLIGCGILGTFAILN